MSQSINDRSAEFDYSSNQKFQTLTSSQNKKEMIDLSD